MCRMSFTGNHSETFRERRRRNYRKPRVKDERNMFCFAGTTNCHRGHNYLKINPLGTLLLLLHLFCHPTVCRMNFIGDHLENRHPPEQGNKKIRGNRSKTGNLVRFFLRNNNQLIATRVYAGVKTTWNQYLWGIITTVYASFGGLKPLEIKTWGYLFAGNRTDRRFGEQTTWNLSWTHKYRYVFCSGEEGRPRGSDERNKSGRSSSGLTFYLERRCGEPCTLLFRRHSLGPRTGNNLPF